MCSQQIRERVTDLPVASLPIKCEAVPTVGWCYPVEMMCSKQQIRSNKAKVQCLGLEPLTHPSVDMQLDVLTVEGKLCD